MKNTFTRRDFVKTTIAGALAMQTAHRSWGEDAWDPNIQHVFVGTYASSRSKGVYVLQLDRKTGAMKEVAAVTGLENPSYLTISANTKFLYTVGETSNFEGTRGGAVNALSLDPETKKMRLLNQQASHGGAPCYITVDKTGRWILVANYSGGNAAVYPVKEDGTLEPSSCLVQHEGSSVNKSRQNEPHAHSIVLSPDERFAFVADLGIDKVMIYRLVEGKLEPNSTPYKEIKPGAGPRHFTFHPNGKLAFLINELDCTMISFAYDTEKGTLEEVQTVPALPKEFSGQSTCADIHVHPSGKFLYDSNRGHDSIVAYAIDDEGKLTYIEHESTQGSTPRNFTIDPSGKILLAANQQSNNVFSYFIDEETGKLEPSGQSIEIPKPVCLKFFNPSIVTGGLMEKQ